MAVHGKGVMILTTIAVSIMFMSGMYVDTEIDCRAPGCGHSICDVVNVTWEQFTLFSKA